MKLAGASDGLRPGLTGRRLAWFALGLLAVLFLAQQIRDIAGFSDRYTNEDQTLLWAAGRELLHGHLWTPNFWGQNYNTVFEAVPGEILHLIGVSLRIADPTGDALIVTVAWAVIAIAAYRRGFIVSAALALALPMVFSLRYMLLFDQLRGVLGGDFLAALAVAACVAIKRPQLRLAIIIACGGLALQWDNATVIAVGPAVVSCLATDWRALIGNWRRTALFVLVGLILPALWFAYDRHFYASRPGALLQSSVPSSLKLSVLWGNLEHPGPLFGFYAPALIDLARVAEILLALLVVAATAVSVRRRRLTPAAVAVAFVVILLIVISVTDTGSNFEPNLYLAGSRFLLPMPFGAWLVAHHGLAELAAHPQVQPGSEARRVTVRSASVVLLGLILVIGVASEAVSQVSFNGDRKQLSADIGVTVENAATVQTTCTGISRTYRFTGAQVLLANDRVLDYACAAQDGLDTLYPSYDRRYWVIDRAASEPVTRILLNDFTCTTIPAADGRCQPLGGDQFLLITPPRPLSDSMAALGIPLWDGAAHPNIAGS